MSVRIQLDKSQGAFTNLDQISGVVVLSILGPETISAITVKLEGESRSHLAGNINPRRNYDGFEKEGSRQEVHKVSECCWIASDKRSFSDHLRSFSTRSSLFSLHQSS